MLKIGIPKEWVLQVVSRKRVQIANRFISLIQKENGKNTCLEIGGPNFIATDILVPYFSRYFIVNPNKNELNNLSLRNTIVPILGDGCQLPIADKSIDFIFCNAVIEHIPKVNRPLLAKEIQRVCKKGFFISTPNYYFPFEPHYHLPFFQYLPETLRRFLLRHITIGFINQHSNEYIKLLTLKELKYIFPKARSGGICTALIPEVIYAYSIDKEDPKT